MKEERKGEAIIFIEAALWGLFPIITVLSYKSVPSIISLAFSTFIASIFFFILVAYKKNLHELKNPLLWKYTLYIVFFIGILYYAFFYLGLTTTTAGNASIIALFEILTSYAFFHVMRGENFSLESKIGSFFMVAGAVIVLAPNYSSIHPYLCFLRADRQFISTESQIDFFNRKHLVSSKHNLHPISFSTRVHAGSGRSNRKCKRIHDIFARKRCFNFRSF